MHQNIQPSNVLVFTHGDRKVIKLADYNGAKTRDNIDQIFSLQPIECLKGGRYTIQSDVW